MKEEIISSLLRKYESSLCPLGKVQVYPIPDTMASLTLISREFSQNSNNSQKELFFFNKIISTNFSINNNVIYVSFENARVAQWLELRAYSNIRFPKFLCQRPFKQAFKSNATVVGSNPTSSTFSFFSHAFATCPYYMSLFDFRWFSVLFFFFFF